MNEEKRDTVGVLSSQLWQKQSEADHTADDQMREQLTDYEKNVFDCLQDGLKKYPGDFYVVVLTKKERLMENVIRNYFFNRISCPTPEYDQTVYKYIRSDSNLNFMWVIPAKDVCEYMRDFPLEVPKSERELLNFVFDFYSDSLLQLAKRENGEQIDSPLLQ